MKETIYRILAARPGLGFTRAQMVAAYKREGGTFRPGPTPEGQQVVDALRALARNSETTKVETLVHDGATRWYVAGNPNSWMKRSA